MSKIGFIGTGVMGKSIIRNMMKNNLSVNVYNRTKSKTDDLVAEGAVWYDTPKAIAEASDIIFTMVGFPSDVEGVYFNETGIFQADLTGKIVVDLTTSTPTLAEKIAKKAAEVGAHALDAPVSGGDLGAKNGTLTIMVGGDQESYDTVLPIFKTFGKTFMLHGSAGKGQHTKMANQLMIAGTMTGLTEMLVYANATGLTLDLKIALDEAKKLDLPLPATQKATELYESLADKGFENDGTQALIKLWWTDGKQPTNKN